MKRIGKQTVCCGGDAYGDNGRINESLLKSRIEEAKKTGAKTLVDVCHYCHAVFADEAVKENLKLVNLVTLVAKALGVRCDDD